MLKRRTCPDGIAFLVPPRLEDSGFLVAFAERTGGVGRGPFASLNLGLKAGDDIENARTNRRRLCRALGLESFAIGRQVHGTRVARVGAKRAGSGFLDPGSAFPATDLLTTAASRGAIAVLR